MKSQVQQGMQKSSMNNKSLLVMMVIVSLVFALTTFPVAIVRILKYLFCLRQQYLEIGLSIQYICWRISTTMSTSFYTVQQKLSSDVHYFSFSDVRLNNL